jgi:hypothetical protein
VETDARDQACMHACAIERTRHGFSTMQRSHAIHEVLLSAIQYVRMMQSCDSCPNKFKVAVYLATVNIRKSTMQMNTRDRPSDSECSLTDRFFKQLCLPRFIRKNPENDE